MRSALFLAVALAAPGFDVIADGAIDPRVRTYVYPTRIVWQSEHAANEFGARFSIEGIGTLLAPKLGQVPERVPEDGARCRLVNGGEAPGVLLDFGREIAGGVQLGFAFGGDPSRGMKLRLRFGESASEAMSSIGEKGATNDHAMRDFIQEVPTYGTITVGETGFRFLRLDLVTTGTVCLDYVRAISMMRPMERRGAFRCSDGRLNRIWDTAVTTAHLCCQERLWDGIKRDRLVWMGDMHPETKTILNVFGAADILPESLDYMAATTPPAKKWMNNIVTYTLWWIRNLAEWYRYTGDLTYVRRHRDYLSRTVDRSIGSIAADNTFTNSARIFIDWPTQHNRPAVLAAAQGLAVLAFRDAAELGAALGDDALAEKSRVAERRLMSQPTVSPNGSKQAAALLALSGLRPAGEMFEKVLGANGHRGVSTFYGYYMLEAMSAAGEDRRALETVRDYWGAMLDVGATSFWEDFNLDWTNNCFRVDELPVPGRKDIHGDYGEFCYPGFRHSLCHGWSSGPASWLINHVLGIRPLEPGCRTVEVKPFLGDLEWAEGAMALPNGGAVKVRVEKRADGRLSVSVDAPADVRIVRKE